MAPGYFMLGYFSTIRAQNSVQAWKAMPRSSTAIIARVLYCCAVQHYGCGECYGTGSGGKRMILFQIGRLIDTAAIVAALALTLGFAGCESEPAHSSVLQQDASTNVLKTATSVPAQKPTLQPVADADSFTTTGPLVVDQQADVLAERDGRLVEVKAEIGDHVAKNQVLALLDSRELQASRAAAAAKVESLKAEVREWQAEQEVNAAD